MNRQIYFSEPPEPIVYGETKHVPLNIVEETTYDSDGNANVSYRADIVLEVALPLSVDNILDAAISSEYTEEDLKRIMRNITKSGDEEVEGYKTFVAEIEAAAVKEGYE